MLTFTLTKNPLIAIRSDGIVCRTDMGVYAEFIASGGIPLPENPAMSVLAYRELRQLEYAPAGDTLDAISKIESGIPAEITAGHVQLSAIANHNIAVKAKYPKV